MSQPNIVKIKVHRNRAGTHIPYDTLYLFERKHRELIPKIWGFALVLPLEDQVVRQIKELKPDEVSHYKFKRDDDTEHVPVKELSDRGTRKELDVKKEDWWNQLFLDHDIEDRVVVIPILTSKLKEKLRPRYLGSSKWFEKQIEALSNRGRAKRQLPQVEGMDHAISELGYLSTPYAAPNDKIRPICSICPRNLEHLQGKCIPGMPICYSSLDFGDILPKDNNSEAANASV